MCARDIVGVSTPGEDILVQKIPDLILPLKKPDTATIHKLKQTIRNEELKVPNKDGDFSYIPDILAFITQFSKSLLDHLQCGFKRFQQTNTYTVLTRTTQPIHALLAVTVLLAWAGAKTDPETTSIRPWKALYVSCVALHIGAQFWMTFVSGLVLYFSLPRHVFGSVQTVLFPTYYTFNSILSFLTLFAYYRIQCITRFQSASLLQVLLMLSVFLIEAYIRLYLVKPMLRLKHIKTQIEKAAGAGEEVGKLLLGDLKHCPHYMRILSGFRRLHSMIAMGTVITFGCSVYNVMFLVDSICTV